MCFVVRKPKVTAGLKCHGDPTRTNRYTPIAISTKRVNAIKGFSSKTIAIRLKELERNGILHRRVFNEIPPRVKYRLTTKGQELAESIFYLLQWMKKW